jgi:YD repeat-containing protein
VTRDGSSRDYDASGRFTGRTEQRGGTLRQYDRQGRSQGRVDGN